jgi:hypothetical protein
LINDPEVKRTYPGATFRGDECDPESVVAVHAAPTKAHAYAAVDRSRHDGVRCGTGASFERLPKTGYISASGC